MILFSRIVRTAIAAGCSAALLISLDPAVSAQTSPPLTTIRYGASTDDTKAREA